MDWEDRYVLGHGPMDAMHREFVDLVTELSTLRQGELAPCLARLAQHSIEHFAAEEEWMAASRFPASASHIQEHKRLLATLASARRLLEKGLAAPARALAGELPGWFRDHTAKQDAALTAHLKTCGTGGGQPAPG